MIDYKVIIAGGRDFDDYPLLKETVHEIISRYGDSITIVSGAARGADRLGERYAYDNGFMVKKIPADWNTLGKRAGFVRNVEMAKYASDDALGILIAFWDGESSGTKHMIDTAKKYGLEIYIINY